MSSENLSSSPETRSVPSNGEGLKITSENTPAIHPLPVDFSKSELNQPCVVSGQSTVCHSSLLPLVSVASTESDALLLPSDSPELTNTNIAAQRVVECSGCVARRVVYHTCGGNSHEHLPHHEYLLSPESLRTGFDVESLQENLDGSLAYGAQSPVSATRVQHTGHSHIPFTSLPVGVTWSPPARHHDCTHCAAPDRRNDDDPHSSGACGDVVPLTGARQFAFGADVSSRSCPVHSTETYITSFDPTFDIPFTHAYSNVHGHPPYLPQYCVQAPRYPYSCSLPGHFQGLPFAPPGPHSGRHHHCCSAVFQDGPHDGRYRFAGHYDTQVPAVPDHHFPAAVSSGTPEPPIHLHICEDPKFTTDDHSVTFPDGEVLLHVASDEEVSGKTETGTLVEVFEKEFEAELPVKESYRIREPEAFFVSSDVMINPSMEDNSTPAQADPAAGTAPRSSISESFTIPNDTDGSSVDRSHPQMTRHAGDVARTHTPPERDVSSADRMLALTADEGGVPSQDAPSARGMTFTIDFGNNQDNPEITENWKQFTPYRTHAGIQQRASMSKSRLQEKSESLEGERHQSKANRVAGSAGTDGYSKTRRGSSGSRSVGGYISDGQTSGRSSDNEAGSICSETRGYIHGGRKSIRNSDPRSFVDQPYTSRSQSSLVKAKPSSKQVQPASSGARPSKGVSSGASFSNKSGSASKKTVDAKPAVAKTAPSKSEPLKRNAKSAKTASETTPGRRLPKRPCDSDAGGKDEEILDVTNYLINRMLFSDKASSNGYRTKSSGGGVVSTQSPKSKSSSARVHRDNNIPDNASETGTYTIEDDGLSGEVQKARDDIDVLFGVDDGQRPLVRPVIESAADVASREQTLNFDKPAKGANVGEDVFEYEPDANVLDCYLPVSNAAASAISATKAIQKAVLQKSSKAVSSSDGHDGKKDRNPQNISQPSRFLESLSTDNQSSDIHHSDTETPSSEPSSAPDRQFDGDACDERDFGTFSVSFDAPSVQKDARYLAHGESLCETDDKTHELPMSGELGSTSDADLLIQSIGATVQELHDAVCKKDRSSEASGGAGTLLSRSVQKPSREATFVKEVISDDASGETGEVRTARTRVSVSSSGRWQGDNDISDAGSESETGSLSSMDYSAVSGQFSRASMLRSSGSKTAFAAPRVNRTFALRCTKAAASDSEPASLVPRSRSAGTDGRLALSGAMSTPASRSGSRHRINSPSSSDISRSRQSLGQPRSTRRRDMEHQHSEDSSASVCSSISSRSSINFVRKDGGRYSMRTERSFGLNSSTPDRLKTRSAARPKSASVQSSSVTRERPKSAGSAASQRSLSSAQTKELNAWKRRKQYDPRKAVAEARAKGTEHGISEQKNHDHSGAGEIGAPKRSFTSHDRRRGDPSVRTDEIARLSSAVAHDLNVLAKSTQKDVVTLDDVQLQHPPVSSYGNSSSRSGFTAPRIARHLKSGPMPVVSFGHVTFIEQTPKGSSENVLVHSIEQVSRKVQVLTDQLITKVRDDKRQGASGEGSSMSPQRSGSAPARDNSSPDLTVILENLRRTEQHLQVAHKALFTDGGKKEALESPQRKSAERQRTTPDRGRYRPIERPASSGSSTKKRTTTKKQSSLSTNPLSGDEYY